MRRKVDTGKSLCKNSSRPLSTDDIQKAKRRARLLQSWSCKLDVGKLEDVHLGQTKASELVIANPFSHLGGDFDEAGCSKANSQEPSILESNLQAFQDTTADDVHENNSVKHDVAEETGKAILIAESLLTKIEQLENQIPWTRPPEIRVDPTWRVATGEESREMEFQSERVKREKEAVYSNEVPIPSDPKEPWDIELDYDDSLTPEIPLEPIATDDSPKVVSIRTDGMQQPRESGIDVNIGQHCASLPSRFVGISDKKAFGSVNNPADTTEGSMGSGFNSDSIKKALKHVTTSNEDSGPDLELLAVLLKNPDLVFALTSDQGARFSKAETVVLLDLLKMSSVKQESFSGITNLGSNKQYSISSMGSADAEDIKHKERLIKDDIPSIQCASVQSTQGLAEPVSTAAVLPSIVSQSCHQSSTNTFYGGGYGESKDNVYVSDLGVQNKQTSLYTNDCLSQVVPFSQDNQQISLQDPQAHMYSRSENGWSQQGSVRPLPPGFSQVQPALTATEDLRPHFVRTSGPLHPPTWPMVTGQIQLKDGSPKTHGVEISSVHPMMVENGSMQATNRETSSVIASAQSALEPGPQKGNIGPLAGTVSSGHPFTKQTISQGSNRALSSSLSNGQSFVKHGPMQHGHVRAPNAPVGPVLPTSNRMQTSSRKNAVFTQGAFSERHDHHPTSSSGSVPNPFKDKGKSSSFDRVRSLVMDFGRDTGRDHTKINYLAHSHGPRPDILPPPPSYSNNMLPPVRPNFVRPEPDEWVRPTGPPANYSQGYTPRVEIGPPRNLWTPVVRDDHASPIFHQVQAPFFRMPKPELSNHPGNFRPQSPWAWNGRGSSSRLGRR
eukprot:Gb_02136 [translate_table: standard]